MKINAFLLSLLLLLISCKKQDASHFSGKVLSVELKANEQLFDSIFASIEVIPLETQEESLLRGIEQIDVYEDNLYIYDVRHPALFVFDKSGKFVRQISKKGQGPGEYLLFYDSFIDTMEQKIYFISPFGYVTSYTMDGDYVEQKVLPIKPNYYSLVRDNVGNWITWSCVEENNPDITVLDKDFKETLYETWRNSDRMLDMELLWPFFQYQEKTYFFTAYDYGIYEVGNNLCNEVYRWDFGKDNIKKNLLDKYLNIEDVKEKNDTFLKDLKDCVIPYTMTHNFQTKDYYFLSMCIGTGSNRPRINVFYRKEDDKGMVLKTIKNTIPLRPLYVSDEYLLATLNTDEVNLIKPILPESESIKLANVKDDSNPCIIKIYFKK